MIIFEQVSHRINQPTRYTKQSSLGVMSSYFDPVREPESKRRRFEMNDDATTSLKRCHLCKMDNEVYPSPNTARINGDNHDDDDEWFEPLRLEETTFAMNIQARDFHKPGDGRPDFIEWCFHAPWKEPPQPLPPAYQQSERSREFLTAKEYLRKCEVHQIKKSSIDERFHLLDPRHSVIQKTLLYSNFFRNDAVPFRNKNVFGAIAALTVSFQQYDGFLPAIEVLDFINEWSKNANSSDMLRLLSYVPYSSLIEVRGHSLCKALCKILCRFVDENVEIARRQIEWQYSRKLQILRNTPSLLDTSATFLDEGTGRIWLCVPTSMYYDYVAPAIIECQQLNISLQQTTLGNDKLLVTSDERKPSKDTERVAAQLRVETTLREMFSKTLLVVEIARISNDFFTGSFLRMLHNEVDSMTRLFRRAMSRGNVIAAIPYSLFAPKSVVFDECSRWNGVHQREHPVTRIAIRYMLRVRRFNRVFEKSTDHSYELERMMVDYNIFRKEAFFPQDVTREVKRSDDRSNEAPSITVCSTTSTLMLRSLETIVRFHGLECALRALSRYDMQKDFLSLMHRYFAFTTWNFLNLKSAKFW